MGSGEEGDRAKGNIGSSSTASSSNTELDDNDEFKCLQLRYLGYSDLAEARLAETLQATMMAKLNDMSEPPSSLQNDVDPSNKGSYEDVVGGLREYGDIKGGLKAALGGLEYNSKVTGEEGTQYDAIASGGILSRLCSQ